MLPKITVILPFHRDSECLLDAIESIQCQTFNDFELILINYNSDDATFHLASSYASKDKRLRLIEEPTICLADALNKGIEKSTSPYIAVAYAGDISYPDRLEKQINYLENNPDVGLVGTRVRYITLSEDPEHLEYLNQYFQWSNRIITHEDISVNRFAESPMIHSTIMFRSSIVDEYGGYMRGDFPEDHELYMRWLEKGVKMYKLPDVLCDWTEEPDRISVYQEKYIDQALFEMKSRYVITWMKENNKFYPEVVVWGAGRTSRQRFFILHELGMHGKFYIDLRANEERKVIQYQHTPPAGMNFILVYVSNRISREKIRVFLIELGYTEGKDFICIA